MTIQSDPPAHDPHDPEDIEAEVKRLHQAEIARIKQIRSVIDEYFSTLLSEYCPRCALIALFFKLGLEPAKRGIPIGSPKHTYKEDSCLIGKYWVHP